MPSKHNNRSSRADQSPEPAGASRAAKQDRGARNGQDRSATEVETRTELHEIRRRRGISAAELAALAGVSRQTIYSIEAGDYVPNTTLALQLARVLEVQVEELFHLEGNPAPQALPVAVDLLLDGESLRNGQPVQICKVGKKMVAVPAVPQPLMLPMADGVVIEGRSVLEHHAEPKQPRKSAERLIHQAHGIRQAEVRLFPGESEMASRLLIAGCDPGISLLANYLAKNEGIELVIAPSSSQQALEWLKAGLVHIAGTHLRDAATGDYNLPAIKRLFPQGGVQVVTFAIWEQGLVFAAGNPKHIHSLADLARKDVRLINREEGAGSRGLLDAELRKAGIAASSVSGYEKTAPGHLPAALAVSLGEADCCIATRSAARAFGLGFLPLATERYDLVIKRQFANLHSVEALLDGLNRAAIRRKLELLAGYDTSHTGEVRFLGGPPVNAK